MPFVFRQSFIFCVKMYLIFHSWCKWLPLALTNGCVKKVHSAGIPKTYGKLTTKKLDETSSDAAL